MLIVGLIILVLVALVFITWGICWSIDDAPEAAITLLSFTAGGFLLVIAGLK